MDIREQVGNPLVKGYCPSCGSKSLFLGNEGYVTCGVIGRCQQPSAAHELLDDPDMHEVVRVASTYALHICRMAVKKAIEVLPERGELSKRLQEVTRERDALKKALTGVRESLVTTMRTTSFGVNDECRKQKTKIRDGN